MGLILLIIVLIILLVLQNKRQETFAQFFYSKDLKQKYTKLYS